MLSFCKLLMIVTVGVVAICWADKPVPAPHPQDEEALEKEIIELCSERPAICQGVLDLLGGSSEDSSGSAEKRHRGMIRFGKRKSAYFRFGKRADMEKRKSHYFRFGK